MRVTLDTFREGFELEKKGGVLVLTETVWKRKKERESKNTKLATPVAAAAEQSDRGREG